MEWKEFIGDDKVYNALLNASTADKGARLIEETITMFEETGRPVTPDRLEPLIRNLEEVERFLECSIDGIRKLVSAWLKELRAMEQGSGAKEVEL